MQKFSLDAQETDIKRYCEYHNLKLKKIEREMASGTKMKKRTKLKHILEDEKFDVLVVTKIDRLARNIMDLNNIVNQLTNV
jgi:DNA invertase Pin-like site-specific DNA recombinase